MAEPTKVSVEKMVKLFNTAIETADQVHRRAELLHESLKQQLAVEIGHLRDDINALDRRIDRVVTIARASSQPIEMDRVDVPCPSEDCEDWDSWQSIEDAIEEHLDQEPVTCNGCDEEEINKCLNTWDQEKDKHCSTIVAQKEFPYNHIHRLGNLGFDPEDITALLITGLFR